MTRRLLAFWALFVPLYVHGTWWLSDQTDAAFEGSWVVVPFSLLIGAGAVAGGVLASREARAWVSEGVAPTKKPVRH